MPNDEDLVIENTEIAAVAVGWRLAHDEVCPMGKYCGRHQPVSAPAQRYRVIHALLSDSNFMATKDRADWKF